ncbi:hypothetical protein [Paenibacillus sp. GYB003]|uniref:hypothetical protein n=1 Tax=Paenibacillus sp. GYB003 TaxID=2994392 RepID=UPI002F964371
MTNRQSDFVQQRMTRRKLLATFGAAGAATIAYSASFGTVAAAGRESSNEDKPEALNDGSVNNSNALFVSNIESVNSVHALLSVAPQGNGYQVSVESYWPDNEGKGHGFWVWRSGVEKTRHNGITIIDPDVNWNGYRATHAFVASVTSYPAISALNAAVKDARPVLGGFLGKSTNLGTGCWVRQDNQISFCNAGCMADADFEVDGTDDSLQMIAAIEALPRNNGSLLIEPYYYTHGSGGADTKSNLLYVDTIKRLTIHANGAVIQSHSGNLPSPLNAILRFGRGCYKVIVNGLEIDGRLDARTAPGGDAGAYNQQSNISIEDACKDFTFNNVTSNRALMDGLTIGYGGLGAAEDNIAEHIVLNHCHFDSNYRQGISCLRSVGFRMFGGTLSNTGTIKGTNPMAGIDFEAEGSQYGYNTFNKDAVLTGVRIVNNKGAGIWYHNDSISCKAIKCWIENNGTYGVGFHSTSKHCGVFASELIQNGKLNAIDGSEIYDFGLDSKAEDCYISTAWGRAILSQPNHKFGASFVRNTIANETGLTNGIGAVLLKNCKQYIGNKHFDLCPSAAVFAVTYSGGYGKVIDNEFYKSFTSAHRAIGIGGNLAELSGNRADIGYANHTTDSCFVLGNHMIRIDTISNNFIEGRSGGRFTGTKQSGILSDLNTVNNVKYTNSSGLPSSGTFAAGDIVADLTGSGIWICSLRGTAGTLSGITANTTASSNQVAVSSLIGIGVGTVLSIASAGLMGVVVLAMNEETQTLTVSTNASSTQTGTAVTYRAPTFKFIAAT